MGFKALIFVFFGCCLVQSANAQSLFEQMQKTQEGNYQLEKEGYREYTVSGQLDLKEGEYVWIFVRNDNDHLKAMNDWQPIGSARTGKNYGSGGNDTRWFKRLVLGSPDPAERTEDFEVAVVVVDHYTNKSLTKKVKYLSDFYDDIAVSLPRSERDPVILHTSESTFQR